MAYDRFAPVSDDNGCRDLMLRQSLQAERLSHAEYVEACTTKGSQKYINNSTEVGILVQVLAGCSLE